jgi:Notch-like protein
LSPFYVCTLIHLFVHPLDKTGVNCTIDVTLCEPNPCEGNGTCSLAFGGHYYQCSCPDNRRGDNCEYVVDPCLGKCGEGETCVPDSLPGSNGFYSPSTTNSCYYMSHDHCSPSPCGGHGTCTGTDAAYECECESGFTGQNCTNIDYCSADNPCSPVHTTACLNPPEDTGAICICSPGWGGDLCDQDIDECLSNPSLCNGSNCVNHQGSYSCENRPLNTTGVTCEEDMCMNCGVCSDVGGMVSCNCSDGLTGHTCETKSEYNSSVYSSPCMRLAVQCCMHVVCALEWYLSRYSNKFKF